MGREIDARQAIEASLAAVQRLRERRTALVEELEEIDQSLENIHRQIGDILSNGRPASGSFPASQSRSFERKAPKKDPELTVNAAVLQVIRDAYKEISKSEIRIGAMRLAIWVDMRRPGLTSSMATTRGSTYSNDLSCLRRLPAELGRVRSR